MTSKTDSDPWSVSTHDLHEALQTYRAEDSPAVVATVVEVEGSAYRRPGAMMLIDPATDSYGAITAGCLEDPVADLARDVLADGKPRVETFDLMDDDGEWGLGLGCRGIIDILLEPLDESWDPIVQSVEDREGVVTVTAIDSSDPGVSVGDRAIIADTSATESPPRSPLPTPIVEDVQDIISDVRKKAGSTSVTVTTDDGAVDLYIDCLEPAPDLLLFGSQNDIHPVAEMGRKAGFRVVIATARGAHDDFPNAHEVKRVHPMNLAEAVVDPDRTYAVLMSHNLIDDQLGLLSLLDTTTPYIGIMGPRERFEELRDALAADEDRELTSEELARISTPVGLDLGGGEPIQIALSIVSEALAVSNDCDGGRLKDRKGPIHPRIEASQL